MRITVCILVYQQPKRLQTILQAMLDDPYPDKEVVVAVDGEITPAIAATIAPFQDRIRLDNDGQHRGKVETLNRVGHAAQTDVLLFFDNDIILGPTPGFLNRLALDMRNVDLAEIPKEAVQDSLISNMIGFEFLGFALATWLFAALARRCPSMNGAAFAVRKEWFEKLDGFRPVVNEDMDFAARAFRQNAYFGYDPRLKVYNDVPTSLRAWLQQRRRWAVNNLIWLREHFIYFLKHAFESPVLLLSMALVLLPFLSIGVIYIIMRSLQLTAFLPFLFMLVQHFHGFAGIFLWITHYQLLVTDGLIPTLAALALSVAFHYFFARGLGFKFNLLYFFLFYFVYSPLWILTNLMIWILVAARIPVPLDWKV